jgi:hypothetical protein
VRLARRALTPLVLVRIRFLSQLILLTNFGRAVWRTGYPPCTQNGSCTILPATLSSPSDRSPHREDDRHAARRGPDRCAARASASPSASYQPSSPPLPLTPFGGGPALASTSAAADSQKVNRSAVGSPSRRLGDTHGDRWLARGQVQIGINALGDRPEHHVYSLGFVGSAHPGN